ncbi:hypothetical protein P4O66_009547 [Electrophorus voltai]|uniref:Uncharacterized protein n=1 Tax=Electrophorus voltai TaxID=2609070 RepID=A0AAD9DWI0_9TELE|nr:hypothetical protein P4O66_009547 [Electrophorus voltai]
MPFSLSVAPSVFQAFINDVLRAVIGRSFHVSFLKPVVLGPLNEDSPDETPPQPIDYDGTPIYAVCHVLDSRRRGRYNTWWTGRGQS